jgi:hypothetical protein
MLLDLGIAKDTRAEAPSHTRVLTTIGTSAWMAPEQADAKEVDGAADRYAFGLMAYALLSGRMPWDEAVTEQRLLANKLIGQLIPLATARSGLPAHVTAAVMKMLSVERADRFDSCAAFIEALERDVEAEARAAREAAEREAREKAEREAREAREAAEREAREKAEREAREKTERLAALRAARQAEREAQEQAEREAQEEADRKSREKAERREREKADREKAERASAEQARVERERAERKAREKAARERAAQGSQNGKRQHVRVDPAGGGHARTLLEGAAMVADGGVLEIVEGTYKESLLIDWPCTVRARGKVWIFGPDDDNPLRKALVRAQNIEGSLASSQLQAPDSALGNSDGAVGASLTALAALAIFPGWQAWAAGGSFLESAAATLGVAAGLLGYVLVIDGAPSKEDSRTPKAADRSLDMVQAILLLGAAVPMSLARDAFALPWWAWSVCLMVGFALYTHLAVHAHLHLVRLFFLPWYRQEARRAADHQARLADWEALCEEACAERKRLAAACEWLRLEHPSAKNEGVNPR